MIAKKRNSPASCPADTVPTTFSDLEGEFSIDIYAF